MSLETQKSDKGSSCSRREVLSALGLAAGAMVGGFLLGRHHKKQNDMNNTRPLAETHLHSDCAHSPESLFNRAKEIYGVESVAELAKIVQAPPGSDWNTWYKHFKQVRRAYTSPQMIANLTGDTIEDNAKQGIDLLELRVSILSAATILLANHGVKDPNPQQFWKASDQIMDALIAVIQQKNASLKMDTDLVISISSQTKYLKWIEGLMKMCLEYREHIIGLDITNEKDNPPSTYGKYIEKIRHEIKGLTVHCMEIKGPERGKDVLNINPDRIGHGINVIKDPKLMEEFAKRGILFEMCLHSNLNSGLFKNIGEHPMPLLHKAGVPLTICQDGTNDRATLKDNYDLARQLGFSDAEMAQFQQNGWDYAFRNL